MSNIWWTGDLHFGHSGVLMHQSNRMNAFGSVEEMDAQLIDTVNNLVKRNDQLRVLGDFCWQASRAGHYRQRLNVRKLHVCQGNHDSSSLRKHVSVMQDTVYFKVRTRGKTFRIHEYHYPLLSWRGLHHGSIHLYGHSHGIYEDMLDKIFPGRRAMDVGIDSIFRLTGEHRPISLDEILDRLVKDEEAYLPKPARLPGPFEGDERMNVVKVTIRPLAYIDPRLAWHIYYADVPTLTKLTADVEAFAKRSLVPMLLEILQAANPVMVSSDAKPPHWRNTVKVAGTPVGIIEYEKVIINSLEDSEKVSGHEMA